MVFIPHLHRHLNGDQFEKIISEINKTEYEKAREPLIHELGDLEYKVNRLEKMIEEYQSIISDILNSIESDYLKILYMEDPPEVKFRSAKDKSVFAPNFKEVVIPIKQGIREHIHSRIIEASRKEKD